MQLEDHAGDVLRKAREGAGLELAAMAAEAGVTADQWLKLERTGELPAAGKSPETLVPDSLKRWGLNPARWRAIAEGWLPSAQDLGRWRELRSITTVRGGNAVHAYLIWDEATREAAVFDAGWDAEPIVALVRQEGLTLRHLFLTHLHEDHVGGMARLRQEFPQLRLHTHSAKAPPEHRNRANDCVAIGSLRVMNRATPGHAEEGVIYIVGNWPEDAPAVAFVGDTIFSGSVATGFQSLPVLLQSVREQILTLPEEMLLAPGHGPVTTVGEERRHNPFFGLADPVGSLARRADRSVSFRT